MARISKSGFGNLTGKLGNMVFYEIDGKKLVRSTPRTSKKKPSTNQQLQRNKFSLVHGFISKSLPLFRVGFHSFSNSRGSYQEAMSYHLKNATVKDDSGWHFNFEKILISHGNLRQAKDAVCQYSDGKFCLSWSDNSNAGYGNPDDEVLVLFYNKTLDEADLVLGGYLRKEEKFSRKCPDTWNHSEVFVYLGFKSSQSNDVSNSSCLGSVMVEY